MSDIVAALRAAKVFPNGGAALPTATVCHEAADEIARLRYEGRVLRRLAALAVNQLSGGGVFERTVTGTQLREAALKAGLFALDDLHHAPSCPANHWHAMRLPTGLCTCGAAAAPR